MVELRPDVSDATIRAIESFMDSVWATPKAEMIKRGQAELRAATSKGVDVSEVRYAYALALMHAGEWNAAEANLRRVGAANSEFPLPHVALAQVYLEQNKISAAVSELSTAAAKAPSSYVTIDAIARFLTDSRLRPNPDTAKHDLNDLVRQLDLIEETQDRFQQQNIAYENFLADEPERRANMLQFLESSRHRLTQFADQIAEIDTTFEKATEMSALAQREYQQTQAIANAANFQWNRQIARAQQEENLYEPIS